MLKAHFNLWVSKIFCCPQKEKSFPVRVVLCCAWGEKEYCKMKIPSFTPKMQTTKCIRAASAPHVHRIPGGGETRTCCPGMQQHWTGQHHKLRSFPLFSSSTGMCFGQLQKCLSWFLPWLAWRVIWRWHWHPGSPLLWVLTIRCGVWGGGD